MVAVQMGQELLQVLTLKDVMLSAKTVLYHILAAVLMEFLQPWVHGMKDVACHAKMSSLVAVVTVSPQLTDPIRQVAA